MVSLNQYVSTPVTSSPADDIPDLSYLTEEEREKLKSVFQKAKEFEEEQNRMKKPIEGQLYKYTNVMKGWQFRWFILTPETGMLEYYTMEETRKHRPRGGLHLAGAVICTSDDDSQSFSISAVCGEVYKLKATNSKERQYWVNNLRSTAEQHSDSPTEMPMMARKIYFNSQRDLTYAESLTKSASSHVFEKKGSHAIPRKDISRSVEHLSVGSIPSTNDSLESIKLCLDKAMTNQRAIVKLIESLPIDGTSVRCSDASLLLLKATSQAAIQSLEHCYLILRQRQFAMTHPKGLPPGAIVTWVDTNLPSTASK